MKTTLRASRITLNQYINLDASAAMASVLECMTLQQSTYSMLQFDSFLSGTQQAIEDKYTVTVAWRHHPDKTRRPRKAQLHTRAPAFSADVMKLRDTFGAQFYSVVVNRVAK